MYRSRPVDHLRAPVALEVEDSGPSAWDEVVDGDTPELGSVRFEHRVGGSGRHADFWCSVRIEVGYCRGSPLPSIERPAVTVRSDSITVVTLLPTMATSLAVEVQVCCGVSRRLDIVGADHLTGWAVDGVSSEDLLLPVVEVADRRDEPDFDVVEVAACPADP